MIYQKRISSYICLLCTAFAQGSQPSTPQMAAAQKADESSNEKILDQYEKEFIAQYGSDEDASLTGSGAFVHFSSYPLKKPYVGLAALFSKQRNVVIIPQTHLGKRLRRLLHARNINFIVDPFGGKSHWIVYSPAGKNNATLLYNSRRAGLITDYMQLHLLGYSNEAIKNEYKEEFESDKVKAEDWLKEQAGTSSWKQIEETFKSLDEDDLLGNGGLYLEGYMARKSDEEIWKENYDFFERERTQALDWIKRTSAKLKLVP
jgi:hypothetical protein